MERLLSSLIILLSSLFSIPTSWATVHEPLRILHVMSYHPQWQWNINQLKGFKDGLGHLPVEYKIVALDTKRISDPKKIQSKVDEAHKIIKEWKPDLLYSNDDNAQKYLAKDYAHSSLPIVFSAVNRSPSEYDFVGAKNVTGVMEYEHFIPSVNLLKNLAGDINKIAVIIDNDPTWIGVKERMQQAVKEVDNLEISEWILVENYADYQQKLLSLQDQVDAVALLGIFNLKDKTGQFVDYKQVLKWTALNSKLPDFSFWESRVDAGTLCAVSVSGYEQGLLAGQMARRILYDKVSPSDIEIQASQKGEPMISLPRAKALGIEIDVQTLLNNTVKNSYQWDD